jgi:hypothetical protein
MHANASAAAAAYRLLLHMQSHLRGSAMADTQERNITPEQPSDRVGKNALGAGLGFIAFAIIISILAVLLIAFGQLPAALLALLVLPIAWGIKVLSRKAEEHAYGGGAGPVSGERPR